MKVKSIEIPGINSRSGLLMAYDTGSDHAIDVADSLLITLAEFMISNEITRAVKKYPSLDIKKVNDMVYSGDSEMKELGCKILMEHECGSTAHMLASGMTRLSIETCIGWRYWQGAIGDLTRYI